MWLSSTSYDCVVLVRWLVFRYLVVAFTSVWEIQTAKHIPSDNTDNKSNHGRHSSICYRTRVIGIVIII